MLLVIEAMRQAIAIRDMNKLDLLAQAESMEYARR